MVNMGELFRFDRISDQEMDRAPLSDTEAESFLLKPGDLLFARQSLVESGTGKSSLVVNPPEPLTFESHLIRARPDMARSQPEYLYYWFRSPAGKARIRSIVTQTGAAGIRSTDLARLSVTAPPLGEQRRIAAVLTALDHKIEHNLSASRRLALVASSEFERRLRGWCATASDGVLGELGEPATNRTTSSDLPYIGLDAMPQGSPVLVEWLTDGAPTGQSSRFSRGDILFGKLRPYFKKVGVAPIDGRCSTEILVLRPSNDAYWGLLLGYALSDDFIAHCIAHSTGTRMPRSEWKNVKDFPVVIPSPDESAQFTEAMRRTFDLVAAHTLESRRLREIRDTLLPKLVSGQIRVPDSYDPDDVLGTVAEAAGVAAP